MKFFSGIKYCMGPGPVPSHQNASGVSLPDVPTDIIHYCIHGLGFIFTRSTICYHWPFNTKVFFGGLDHHGYGSVENNETLNIIPLSPLQAHFLISSLRYSTSPLLPTFHSQLPFQVIYPSGSEQVFISL